MMNLMTTRVAQCSALAIVDAAQATERTRLTGSVEALRDQLRAAAEDSASARAGVVSGLPEPVRFVVTPLRSTGACRARSGAERAC